MVGSSCIIGICQAEDRMMMKDKLQKIAINTENQKKKKRKQKKLTEGIDSVI